MVALLPGKVVEKSFLVWFGVLVRSQGGMLPDIMMEVFVAVRSWHELHGQVWQYREPEC